MRIDIHLIPFLWINGLMISLFSIWKGYIHITIFTATVNVHLNVLWLTGVPCVMTGFTQQSSALKLSFKSTCLPHLHLLLASALPNKLAFNAYSVITMPILLERLHSELGEHPGHKFCMRALRKVSEVHICLALWCVCVQNSITLWHISTKPFWMIIFLELSAQRLSGPFFSPSSALCRLSTRCYPEKSFSIMITRLLFRWFRRDRLRTLCYWFFLFRLFICLGDLI